MRTLIYDIETSPIVADVWGLWQQNVGLNQIHEVTRMLCFAAKWKGDNVVEFASEWQMGHEDMVYAAWELLDEAEAVVHFNGDRFDTKHMNREFAKLGLGPPSPYRSIDVLKSVKARFALPSNKLQYVSTWLGLEGKLAHTGHSLWTDVLAGNKKAQKLMEDYNIQDVVLLEEVYDRLLPWLVNHPNQNLYGGEGCPQCGSESLQKRGFSYTNLGKFQQYRCNDCGSWSKDTTKLDGTKQMGVK